MLIFLARWVAATVTKLIAQHTGFQDALLILTYTPNTVLTIGEAQKTLTEWKTAVDVVEESTISLRTQMIGQTTTFALIIFIEAHMTQVSVSKVDAMKKTDTSSLPKEPARNVPTII